MQTRIRACIPQPFSNTLCAGPDRMQQVCHPQPCLMGYVSLKNFVQIRKLLQQRINFQKIRVKKLKHFRSIFQILIRLFLIGKTFFIYFYLSSGARGHLGSAVL